MNTLDELMVLSAARVYATKDRENRDPHVTAAAADLLLAAARLLLQHEEPKPLADEDVR